MPLESAIRAPSRGTPDELKRSIRGDSVSPTFPHPDNTVAVAEIASRLEGATEPVIEGSEVRFNVPDGASVLPGLLRGMVDGDIELTGVEVHRPTLDDVFLTLTGRSPREEDKVDREPAGQAA